MKTISNFEKVFLIFARRVTSNFASRKLIFLIDVSLSFLSLEITLFLVSLLGIGQKNPLFFSWPVFVVVAIQAICFLIFKSYRGIVRYANFKDILKQLEVTAVCVAVILFVKWVAYLDGLPQELNSGTIIIYGFILFSFLLFFRMIVKRTWELLISSRKAARTYILGTDQNDVAMANRLISERSCQFRLAGFLHEKNNKFYTRILGLPILNLEQFRKLSDENIAVIVGENKLKKLGRSDNPILSQLLELNVKLYKLPDAKGLNGETTDHELRKINLEDLLQRNPINLDLKLLEKHYRDKVILVTGAAGSIGSEIVKQLIPLRPKKIILLDQAETPLHYQSLVMRNYPDQDATLVIGDIRDKRRLESVFRLFTPQVVFHAAAYKHVPMMEANVLEALKANFLGTKNLVDLSVDYAVERFVFISTDKAVNPTSIMGATKRASEIYVQSVACNSATLFMTTRFGNVLGSNGSVIPRFKEQIESGGPVTVTDPEITRYFMTINEACQLVLEAGGMGKGGEIFVFDMGKPIKIVDLARNMIRLSGLVPEKDIAIKFVGLRPGEKLYEELLANKETTLPTYHEKILIADATHNFTEEKVPMLNALINAVNNRDLKTSLHLLKTLVPEFVSPKEKMNPKEMVFNR